MSDVSSLTTKRQLSNLTPDAPSNNCELAVFSRLSGSALRDTHLGEKNERVVDFESSEAPLSDVSLFQVDIL